MAGEPACLLAVDVGTGSVRAAVVREDGHVISLAQKEHATHNPQPGWVEQDPAVWWAGTRDTIRDVLQKAGIEPKRIASVCVCGQMHGPVPLDSDGNVLLDRVQLWNDKRGEPICQRLRETGVEADLLSKTANPIAASWTALKVAWIREHQPEVYSRTRVFLVPKDFINFRLTGQVATDYSEASGGFLLDRESLSYSADVARELGLDIDKFAPPHPSETVIGNVTETAAAETGLAKGTPVVAGGGDFPVSLLGSGITRPGIGSDLTGTSTLISVYTEKPLLGPRVMNLHAAGRGWIAFTLLDAGGDSMRWARRTVAPGDAPFDTVNALAAGIDPGAEGLIFLPYLTGERIGGRADSRAQFAGITAGHEPAHFYRAVMEGVALASNRNIHFMRNLGSGFDEIAATGGGAKGRLWLDIKAAVYNLPIRVPANVESGVLGCAILAGCGVGLFDSPEEASAQLVSMADTIEPDPEWVEAYRRVEAVFSRLYDQSQELPPSSSG